LFFKLVNGAGEPGKLLKTVPGFTWHVQNIAAISQEEFQKSIYEAYPRVLFSSFGSRNPVYEYLTTNRVSV